VGALVGLVIGVLTAFARVFDYAHTIPEVIAGWLLGALVAALFVHPLARSSVKLFQPLAAAAGLLLVTTVAYGHHAPIQAMIDHYSPGICARVWASASALF
jgi:hypothetical protein